MPIYRYKKSSAVAIEQVKKQVPPADAASVSSSDSGSEVVWDIDAPATSKDDLDFYLLELGWEFVETAPSDTPAEAAAADIPGSFITGVVPDARTVTAGGGLTGGGDLSADRTFDVAANVDGSITVNPNDIQVGVLASDAQHGVRGGGTQHAAATASVAGFLSAADKVLLDAAVPDSRDLTAGAGLTGGGDLSADRTFDVVANADGSIAVNANDIQVGVLASDAQHGSRGGGLQHAIATAVLNGFMSASDKAKLDGIAPIPQYLKVGQSGDVDYTSVKLAVDAAIAGGASGATPWVVEVFPGDYTEDPFSIIGGLTLIGKGSRGKPVRIIANNANADLITMTGGQVEAVRLEGVTNVANALVRCTGLGSSQLANISISNCSTGISVGSNATAIMNRVSAFISGPGQGITTCIDCSGATSEIFIDESTFTVLPAFLALYPGVNPIETCISVSASKAVVRNANIRVAYNVATQTGVTADNGAQVSLFSSTVETCANGVVIGAGGSNTRYVIQAAIFLNNLLNGVINSATGVIFVAAASDDIKFTTVAGGKLTGVIQKFTGDETLIAGDTEYAYRNFRQVNLAEYLHDINMSAVVDGGVVSDGGGLTVDVSAGRGYSVTTAPDEDAQSIVWTATSAVALTASATNFVYYDASLDIITSTIGPPAVEDILLATVVTNVTGIRYLHTTRNEADQQGTLLHDYLVETRKIAWTTGVATSQGSTARKLDISTGSYYRALDLLTVAGGTDVSWSYYYGTAAATEVSGISDLDITQYDNAGVLTNMSTGFYRADTVIVTSDNRVSIIYGNAEFSTQSAAEDAANKALMPAFLDPTGCFTALVVVQEAVGIASIVDIRPDPNAATAGGAGGGGGGTNDHSALINLTANDHPQYFRVDGTSVMTGNANIGGGNIVNVGTVDGVTVSAHVARHNPGGLDAIATGAPIQIGTTNAAGSAASVSRSDHQHAHGIQTDQTLHVAATPTTAGFLSAADKVLLNAAVPDARALTAGAGLTGGGDLSADRTFDVVANADGSITVNANDIQVGVLASDAQHGVRGGGTQHAAATTSVAGFLSAADKVVLDAAVPDARALTAGAGLTGGGDLSANRTFDVVANADGSITVNANDIQVGVLASDAQHGVRGGGTQHAAATPSVAGFLSAADKVLLDAAVPDSRDLTAGAGLTGGGDLSANRTFNVVANADGSITVNANDIQVGVLASDAQHGVRGGGTQHAAATTSVNGFMSATDKTKLDGIGAGATAFKEYYFQADQFESPNSADWTINALAPVQADSVNAALSVRPFDDTVQEGVGFTVFVPSGATNLIIEIVARAVTAPGAAATVIAVLYNRGIADNGAVGAWTAGTTLTGIAIPTNANFQYDSQTISLATLSVTAGQVHQFELTRNSPLVADSLTGDWALHSVRVRFS
jgi:hypothetical protein